jgi:hypothetical protein
MNIKEVVKTIKLPKYLVVKNIEMSKYPSCSIEDITCGEVVAITENYDKALEVIPKIKEFPKYWDKLCLYEAWGIVELLLESRNLSKEDLVQSLKKLKKEFCSGRNFEHIRFVEENIKNIPPVLSDFETKVYEAPGVNNEYNIEIGAWYEDINDKVVFGESYTIIWACPNNEDKVVDYLINIVKQQREERKNNDYDWAAPLWEIHEEYCDLIFITESNEDWSYGFVSNVSSKFDKAVDQLPNGPSKDDWDEVDERIMK